VQTAYTATQALELVESFVPDVVLLDIGLPEIDGYEVARRIRRLGEHGKTRLVALTCYGQAEDRRRAQAVGFDDHLVKPIEFRAPQQALVDTTDALRRGAPQ
jgi:CheY-like chemotaxis protein